MHAGIIDNQTWSHGVVAAYSGDLRLFYMWLILLCFAKIPLAIYTKTIRAVTITPSIVGQHLESPSMAGDDGVQNARRLK
jgi:hypothetical protein